MLPRNIRFLAALRNNKLAEPSVDAQNHFGNRGLWHFGALSFDEHCCESTGPKGQSVHNTKVIIRKSSYATVLMTAFAVMLWGQPAEAQSSRNGATASSETIEIASVSLPSAPAPDLRMHDAAMTPAPFFASPVVAVRAPEIIRPQHLFWDRENSILFAATGVAATADFFVTRMNLSGGGRELNPLVRPLAGSTAGLATNFAVQTASVIGISYLFHKTGHHRLERFTSVVNISSSTGAVAYGITHR